MRAFLELLPGSADAGRAGVWVPIPAGGLVIGRAPTCHVVVESETASAIHAIVRVRNGKLELVPVGLNPILLDGQGGGSHAQGEPAILGSGDVFALRNAPGSADLTPRFRVRLDQEDPHAARCWTVRLRGDSRSVGIVRSPFTIGGGADDMVVPGWPGKVVTLWRIGAGLRASLAPRRAGPPLLVDGVTQPGPGMRVVPPFLSLALGDDVIEIEARDVVGGPSTKRALASLPPDELCLCMTRSDFAKIKLVYGRGRWGTGDAEIVDVTVGPRVARLLEVLIWQFRRAPSEPLCSELLAALAWPVAETRLRALRSDVNTVTCRLRERLLDKGIDALDLVRTRSDEAGRGWRTCLNMNGCRVAPPPTGRVDQAWADLAKRVREELPFRREGRSRGIRAEALSKSLALCPDALDPLLRWLAEAGLATCDPAFGWQALEDPRLRA